jgi:cyclomaltodextrin glucanotransferase
MAPTAPAPSADPASAQSLENPVLSTKDVEFRAEVIYFVVVDRFFDGDPNNNTGVDPTLTDDSRTDWGKYWGGDLQGVIDKLDYLQKLGVTAVWLTPLFEQIERMVWDAAPIHGYWAKDWKRLNRRWVSNDEEVRALFLENTVFDRLVEALHARGMKLVFDIVCNHSSPDVNGIKGRLYDDGKLIADFHDDKNHWYHHYGSVEDWDSDWQVKNCELAGLATFNENNTDFRNYVKSSIRQWLDKGIDAVRIDTVKHMPLWFWQEFSADMLSHKPDLFLFGEWIYSHPEIAPSVEFANKSGVSMLDFGFAMALRQCLGQHHPRGFALLEDIFAQDDKYRCSTELVTFVDNHDMPRFGSLNPDHGALRLAMVVLYLARGIPCVYYGTEQHLHVDENGGNDPYNRPMMASFDEEAPLFRDMAALARVRHENLAVQFGRHRERFVSPDVYVFTRHYQGAHACVIVNRADEVILPRVDTDLPDGTYRCQLTGRELTITNGGLDELRVYSQEAIVLSVEAAPCVARAVARIQFNGFRTAAGQQVFVLGDRPELGEWDLGRAVRLEYIHANLWQGDVCFEASAGQPIAYKFVVIDESTDPVSAVRENRTVRRRVAPLAGVAKWRDVWEE